MTPEQFKAALVPLRELANPRRLARFLAYAREAVGGRVDHQLHGLAGPGTLWIRSEDTSSWWSDALAVLDDAEGEEPSATAAALIAILERVRRVTDDATAWGLYLLLDARLQRLRLYEADFHFAAMVERRHDRKGLWAIEQLRRHRVLGWYDDDTRSAIATVRRLAPWRLMFVRNMVREIEWRALGAAPARLEGALADARASQVAREQAIGMAADLGWHGLAASLVNAHVKSAYAAAVRESGAATAHAGLDSLNDEDAVLSNEPVFMAGSLPEVLRHARFAFCADLERAKTIAIVGNGPSEIGKGRGDLIDSHDLVIRFNNFSLPDEHRADYGIRTDIVFAGLSTLSNRKHPISDDVLWVVLGNDRLLHRVEAEDLHGAPIGTARLCGIAANVQLDLCQSIGAEPSLGLKAIHQVMQDTSADARIRLFGFSFSSPEDCRDVSAHYFEVARPSFRHKWSNERTLVDTWRQAGHIAYGAPDALADRP